MDKVLKQRLIGASILIALAVIFLPMFFDAPQDDRGGREMSIDLPESPTDRAQVRRMPLDPDQARRPAPEPASEPAPPMPETMEQPPEDDPVVVDDRALPDPREDESPDPSEADVIAPVEPVPEVETEEARDPPLPEPIPEPEPEQVVSESAVAVDPAQTEGWLVQVASFGSETTANEIVERLTGLGHVAGVERLVRGEMTLYRVATGPYPDRETAERARGQIERTVTGVTPVVRTGPAPTGISSAERDQYAVQLGSFASRGNAERLVAQLVEMEFDAFIHEDGTGGRAIWRVRMGPYGSRSEAESRLTEVGDRAGLEGLVVSHP